MDLDFKTNPEDNQNDQPINPVGGDLDFKNTSNDAPNESDDPQIEEGNEEEVNTEGAEPNIDTTGESNPPVDSSDNTEGEGMPSDRGQDQPPTQVELSDEVVTEYLTKKLGKDIKIEDLTKEQEPENEYITKLKEWQKKTGRPIQDWVEYTKDYSSIEPEEVLRLKIKQDYPDLTEAQVELELDNWLILEDDDDRTQQLKELKLAKELPKIRKELQDNALSFGEPIPDMLTPEMKAKLELANEIVNSSTTLEEERRKDQEVITSTLESLNEIPFKLDDDISLTFKLDSPTKENVLNYLEKGDSWLNPDGTFNHNKLIEDASKIVNFDKIVKMAYEQGMNKGIEKTIKDSSNSNVAPITPNSNTKVGKGPRIEGEADLLGGTRFKFK